MWIPEKDQLFKVPTLEVLQWIPSEAKEALILIKILTCRMVKSSIFVKFPPHPRSILTLAP